MWTYRTKTGDIKRIENSKAFFLAMKDRKEIDSDGNISEPLEVFQKVAIQKSKDGPIKFVMSDDSLDRHDERIDQSGWELENFKKNPVLLWDHTYWYLPLGRVENVMVEDNKLIGELVFTGKDIPQSGNGPQGYVVGEMLKQGFLYAGSVGMIVKRVEFQDDTDEVILRKQELLEFSIVTVPANPNALVQNNMATDTNSKEIEASIEEGFVDFQETKELLQKQLKALEDTNKKIDDVLVKIAEIASRETNGAPDPNQEPEQKEEAKTAFFLNFQEKK